MKLNPSASTFIFVLLMTTYVQSETANINMTNDWDFFNLISHSADTLPNHTQRSDKGKWIDPNLFAKPKSIPIKDRLNTVPARTHIHPAGNPKVVELPDRLRMITPGKDGFSLPKIIPAQGKVSMVRHSEPVIALPPRFKDTPITNIQYLDVDQGLNNSFVISLIEDREGNLWFGSFGGGVSRYDGNNLIHFTTKEGLTDNRINSILEDREGYLWFGTNGGGICKYDGHYFTHYTTEEGLSNNIVLSMIQDIHGNLWFGTKGGGLYKFDGSYFSNYTEQEGLSHNTVLSICEDGNGALWIGTQNGGVNRFDGQKFTQYGQSEGFNASWVSTIKKDSQDNLWFGTENGVIQYDGHRFYQFGTLEGLSANQVWAIQEDSHGNLWFGTFGGGVSLYDGNNFTHFTEKEGLSSNQVRTILEDSHGNLWFGTYGGGVSRLGARSFSHLTTKEGLSGNEVWAIEEDRHGNLWFGTYGGGISKYDGNSFTQFTTKEGLMDNRVLSIREDSRGNLWLGNRYGGISRLMGQNIIHFTDKEGFGSGRIRAIVEDNEGNIWFGSNGDGVSRYDGQAFTNFTEKDGLSSNYVTSIIKDHQGDLWIGTQNAGISQFDGTKFINYTTAEGLSNNVISSILEDHNGHLWFGTYGGGINRFDKQKFTHFTEEDGLSNDFVLSIEEDNKNNLWISTEKGLSLMIPKPNDPSFDKGYQFLTFGKADGLTALEFYSSSLLDSKNQIWWGGTKNLIMLDLNQFELPTQPPKNTTLTHIEIQQQFVDFRRLDDSVYSKQFSFGEALNNSFDSVVPFYNYPAKLKLPYNVNHLTFHFSGKDWIAPHKIKYSYFMEGLDDNWSLPNSENKADYRNLSFGTYTFKVRAIGEAQVWSQAFKYTFTISAPWWLTLWASFLYILTGILLFFGIIRWRTRRLRTRQKILEQKISERTSEVVAQKKRSDELLLNILPLEVAEELKKTGRTQPMQFDEVSILFTDFKDFTNIVASIPGKKLVEELDEIFQKFDDIIEEEGLEKIQTIGDAYLAVGGLPKEIPNHAIKCVHAAKKMITYLNERNEVSALKWKIRLGIHSGPVTAGVVGKRKFSYDIFGDTVNIASRIESSGEEGKINISAYTYDKIKDQFECKYRGKINAKGKGELDMYFVK